ncbi:helix-turn-helix transcriptional regulator [Sphingomonas sp. 35-24ZXX]|uniref:helix-turn-helix transcriptional regulator n=1 Tax=Sphingomonas sp. 35-24ZXX TaxID=1545915 RepID=UPI00053BFF5F|nr:AlpA family transcriptional regulator [Sphingomonas sp. 35-24ZXX]
MTQLIRLPDVIARTGKSRSRIYAEIETGEFPRPVKIGERAVAWPAADIDGWIAQRIAARDAGVQP